MQKSPNTYGQFSREVALKTLQTAYRNRQSVEAALPAEINKLSPQDQRLCHAMVQLCIRNWGQIDAIINQCMDKPFKDESSPRMVLRLGLAQLLFMDGIADHAAINTTVELAKSQGLHKFSGVINGVLRSVQREREDALSMDKILNIPEWITKQMQDDFGEDYAREVLVALQNKPSVTIRVRNSGITNEYQDISNPISGMANALEITDKSIDLNALPGLKTGDVYVQDPASQLPAQILVNGVKADGAILDMCAAPGGKTIQLADLLPNRQIIALDSSKKRIKRLKQNLETFSVEVGVVQADATDSSWFNPSLIKGDDDKFAGILVDAPCSALGTARRHPEVFFTRSPNDIPALTNIQANILEQASSLLKVGGCLVYSTCSILKAEGEYQIDAFLKAHPNFELSAITPEEIPNQNWLTSGGQLRVNPADGADGFFVARLVKLK